MQVLLSIETVSAFMSFVAVCLAVSTNQIIQSLSLLYYEICNAHCIASVSIGAVYYLPVGPTG